jgi:hypothetical protein
MGGALTGSPEQWAGAAKTSRTATAANRTNFQGGIAPVQLTLGIISFTFLINLARRPGRRRGRK